FFPELSGGKQCGAAEAVWRAVRKINAALARPRENAGLRETHGKAHPAGCRFGRYSAALGLDGSGQGLVSVVRSRKIRIYLLFAIGSNRSRDILGALEIGRLCWRPEDSLSVGHGDARTELRNPALSRRRTPSDDP